jgi:hypothetical protein
MEEVLPELELKRKSTEIFKLNGSFVLCHSECSAGSECTQHEVHGEIFS